MTVEQNVTQLARSSMRTAGSPMLTAEQAVDLVDEFARRLQRVEAELAIAVHDVSWLPVKRRGRPALAHALLGLQLERQHVGDTLKRHGYERPQA